MLSRIQQKRRSYMAKLHDLLPVSERSKYDIRNLREGSVLRFSEKTYVVDEVATYTEVKWNNFAPRKTAYVISEYKLFCISDGSTVYLEWEEDDEVESYLTVEEIKLDRITAENSVVTRSVVEAIAEEEDGDVMCGGTTYHYEEDDTYAALYNSSKHHDIPVRMFAFESDAGRCLTIEFWYNDSEDEKPEREAYISELFDIDDAEILKV